jgi:hypothetical protein
MTRFALPFWLILALAAACDGLHEREDLLLWRICEDLGTANCDRGQTCLPHEWDVSGPSMFRCRDSASFHPGVGGAPPLAYCDGDLYVCPESVICQSEGITEINKETRWRLTCVLEDSDQADDVEK